MDMPCDCEHEQKEKDAYCGFCCDDVKDALERMLIDLDRLHDINPEFAVGFADKMIGMIERAKQWMQEKPHREAPAAKVA